MTPAIIDRLFSLGLLTFALLLWSAVVLTSGCPAPDAQVSTVGASDVCEGYRWWATASGDGLNLTIVLPSKTLNTLPLQREGDAYRLQPQSVGRLGVTAATATRTSTAACFAIESRDACIPSRLCLDLR